MYALQAQLPGTDIVVGYYICNENDSITHAWERPNLDAMANLQKMVSEDPFALFVLAEKLIAKCGLAEKPAHLVKTFGRVSTEHIGP